MIVSLGNSNKCIHMGIDEYLSMEEQDFQALTGWDQGYVINSPFSESVLYDLRNEAIQESLDDEEDEELDNSLFSESDLEDILQNDSYTDN